MNPLGNTEIVRLIDPLGHYCNPTWPRSQSANDTPWSWRESAVQFGNIVVTRHCSTRPQRCRLFRRISPTGIDSPAAGSTASWPRRRLRDAVSPAEGSTSRRQTPGSTSRRKAQGSTVVHGPLCLAAAKAPILDKLGRPNLTLVAAVAGRCWSEGSN